MAFRASEGKGSALGPTASLEAGMAAHEAKLLVEPMRVGPGIVGGDWTRRAPAVSLFDGEAHHRGADPLPAFRHWRHGLDRSSLAPRASSEMIIVVWKVPTTAPSTSAT